MAKELLTDQTIRSTKAQSKNIRLSDGNNLYLLIKPNNSHLWRVDYSINSKRKTLSLFLYLFKKGAESRFLSEYIRCS